MSLRLQLLAVALLCGAQPLAQAEVSHQLTPYLWGAGLSGVVGAGDLEADVDASFSDILSNLDIGLMANYRADSGDWLFIVDGMYIDLSGSGHGSGGVLKVNVDVEQTLLEFDAGRKIARASRSSPSSSGTRSPVSAWTTTSSPGSRRSTCRSPDVPAPRPVTHE